MSAAAEAGLFWAPSAWCDGAWHDDVLLRADAQGAWAEVRSGVGEAPAGAQALAGPVLPGLVDAHSHAFQRAMAGLAERRELGEDDFWSWRERMYGIASRITAEQLRAVAAQLYVELLLGGYTQVAEFHYLQHDPGGAPYGDPLTLAWAVADAANDAGIGMTLLPVLYERAGFTLPRPSPAQRRFTTTPASVRALHRAICDRGRPQLNAGLAVHSLRAANAASIRALATALDAAEGPLHIHVAEQTAEVDDCLHATGARPIAWLAREGLLEARWQLVHATHADAAEIDAVARSGAGVVLCPGTEANLGDGLADVPAWLGAGVPLSLGSDSQVTRAWAEELRWLEYGQRLHLRRRNVAAAPARQPATAARLFDAVLRGGGRAAGFARWGLQRGARADFLVLDIVDPSLLGVPATHRLDALVFSAPGNPIRDVYVAGRPVIRERRHAAQEAITGRFVDAMAVLWNP